MDFTVTTSEAGQRLDIYCAAKLPDFSRAALQKAIRSGTIQLNGKQVKPGQVVHERDQVTVAVVVEGAESTEEKPLPTIATLFENKDVVVIDKPAGIAMYGGSGTVADWLHHHYPETKELGSEAERAGVVHRLDKDTSGVVIMAKTAPAEQHLLATFKKHQPKKEYLALVFGVPGEPDGRIVRPLLRSSRNPMRRTVSEEGKPAVTEWKAEEKFGGKYALLRVFPLTGRTHQIRAHLHWLGFPIIGDHLYTFRRQKPPAGVTRQLLHAEVLHIRLPDGSRQSFTAPLAADFAAVLDQLRHDLPDTPTAA